MATTHSTLQRTGAGWLQWIAATGCRPVDGASCFVFRIAFGLLMAKWSWDYLATGRVAVLYIEPAFHFTYPGFEWVRPWPGEGMYWHFLALLAASLCIAAGCCFRIASLLFAAGFTYFFLLERTNYQNHYYMVMLIAWWLPCMPLSGEWSCDSIARPSSREGTVPAWTLWMLRFHVAVPYVFGGLAKLDADWLLGEPMSSMLRAEPATPIVGSFLANRTAGLLFSWGGLLFDLAIVPLLLSRHTRGAAYLVCVAFHITNAVLFDIHVFPWLMIAATTLFFSPDWPRRFLRSQANPAPCQASSPQRSVTPAASLAAVCMLAYVAFQCGWPLRSRLSNGNPSWTERGHRFSWRMMLRGKEVLIGYAIRDTETGDVTDARLDRLLSRPQAERFGRDPEMILQLAHHLGESYVTHTGHSAEVYALVLASLNGRKPALMIDPNADLMQQSTQQHAGDWVLPLEEPLRADGWDVPVDRWRELVEIPPLTFLPSTRSPTTSARIP